MLLKLDVSTYGVIDRFQVVSSIQELSYNRRNLIPVSLGN